MENLECTVHILNTVISSGGIKGGMGENTPQSEALPPSQKKKRPKSAIFGKFLDFCPLRIAFCPLDAPHKKKKKKILVPPLVIRKPLDLKKDIIEYVSSSRNTFDTSGH